MKRCLRVAFAVSLLGATALSAEPGLARPGMGGGGGLGMGASMGGFSTHSMGGVNGQFGGSSGSHISAQGSANTNGPNAVDRDTGLERAQDRMSDEGKTHNKASANQTTDNDTDDQPSTTTSASVSTSVK